ncbi:MAG: inositol monophosphatase family protein [Acidimicrobiales bacterium]
MTESILSDLRTCALEIGGIVESHRGRGFSGVRETQYHLDLAADEVAVRMLVGGGYRVVSEESGVTGEGDVTIVVDPIDGSTNCDRGVPFFATSLAAMRGRELVAGVVMNHATGTVFEAEKGAGASRDGATIMPSSARVINESVISFSGWPSRHLGWQQMRALGAASLEICLVADGSLDAFAVAQHSTLNPWDYLAGLLVVREAGAVATDYRGEGLETFDPVLRRPIFCATKELLDNVLSVGAL